MNIDYNEIGNSAAKEYRPYVWIGEPHDAHVEDWRVMRFGQMPRTATEHYLMSLGLNPPFIYPSKSPAPTILPPPESSPFDTIKNIVQTFGIGAAMAAYAFWR